MQALLQWEIAHILRTFQSDPAMLMQNVSPNPLTTPSR